MRVFYFMLMICCLPALAAAAPTSNSGLPLPRFVSLKSAEVNVRTGPGTRYPIQYVYRRDGMPVEVIEEFDLWRKIRDVEGTSGWVHKTMLDGKRNVLVKGKESHIVRNDPEADAAAMFKVEPMVIAKLVACEKTWCRIQVSGRKGWIEKAYLWGVYSADVFD